MESIEVNSKIVVIFNSLSATSLRSTCYWAAAAAATVVFDAVVGGGGNGSGVGCVVVAC